MSASLKSMVAKRLLTVGLVLILASLACGLPDLGPTETPALQQTEPVLPVTEPPATEPPAATEPPVVEVTTETEPPAAGQTGFVALKNGKLQAYDLYGTPGGQPYEALDLQWLSEADLSFYPDAIYFAAFDSAGRGGFRTSAQGAQPLSFIPSTDPVAVAVSKETNRIAWSVDIYQNNPGGEIWIANLDGSNAQRVVYLDPATNANYTVLKVRRFEADGSLLYSIEPTGIGGYILYGGWSSLYRYDPATNQTSTILEYGDTFICVDDFAPEFRLAALHCDQSLTIRNLQTQVELSLPAVEDQGQLGSAYFSPSADYVAYAVARGDPEHEGSKLVLARVDGSTAPAVIAQREGGVYKVEGWINEDTLLVSWSDNFNPGYTLSSIRSDGSALTELVSGAQFVGWLP